MIFIVSILFVFSCIFAVVSNKDIFSPGKLFLVFFFIFHVGGLFILTSNITGVLVLVVLGTGLFLIVLEAGVMPRSPARRTLPQPRAILPKKRIDYTAFLWLVSIPSILAQLYMIWHFGGIEGYFRSISLRVVEWAGFGWARTLIAIYVPINIVYFGIGLRQRRSGKWWTLYGIHFAIVVSMGLLSGSRSILLNVCLIQLLSYHYIRKQVKAQYALFLAGVLVFASMTLAVARNVVKLEGGSFTTGSSTMESASSVASFSYGIAPLEIIANTEYPVLANGSTFFSLFTNAIPRDFWPNKPESGGVFFTKNYVGDIWRGYSNLTPTFLGEWIINFGWDIGIIGFFLSFGFFLLRLNNSYKKLIQRLDTDKSDVGAIDVIIYIVTTLGIFGLLVGEVTNVILSLVTTQLIPLWGVRWFVALRSAR